MGKDGFRRLNIQQMRAMQEHSPALKKKKKGKKAKSGDHSPRRKKTADDEIEKMLDKLLKAVNIDASNGPIWKTVRVNAADEDVKQRATWRDHVEKCGRIAREKSKGKVGYVHVPDCMELGYAEFYRYFRRECDREALIIDVRCNTGGCIAELLLRQFHNIPIGWNIPRDGRNAITLSPEFCTRGKLILLIDENSCSDAELWAGAFKHQNLGKIVGERTWGGVISIGGADYDLIDQAELTLPFEHFYTGKGGYTLENYGACPDVVIQFSPDTAMGTDPQLERAVEEALKLINSAASPFQPEFPPFPRTRLHRQAGTASTRSSSSLL